LLVYVFASEDVAVVAAAVVVIFVVVDDDDVVVVFLKRFLRVAQLVGTEERSIHGESTPGQ
jgi:hypothetical protein